MSAPEILAKLFGVVVGILRVIYLYMEALYRQIILQPLKSIDGETILITGASGGIGKEICRHLNRSGNNIKLVLWDLNLPELKKLASELKANNSTTNVFTFAVDISKRENIVAACKEVKDKIGDCTVVFNNAGVLPAGNLLQQTDEEIELTFQVNLTSNLWILRELLPSMVINNRGHIVNTCSLAGVQPLPFCVPYCSSKYAVNGYTEALKCELEQFQYNGIHVTTLYPYFVQTGLVKTLKMTDEMNSIFVLPSIFKRFQQPAEVANSVVNGMRRNYEFVYCPSSSPFFLFTDYLIPTKLRKQIQKMMTRNVAYKDETEQKMLQSTYMDTIKNQKEVIE